MRILKWIFPALLIFVLASYNACDPLGKNTLSSEATRGGNPIVQGMVSAYFPARLHVGCFTRYSYYDLEGNFYSETLQEPRVIEFDPNGTKLGELILADKTLHTFELIFEPRCQSPKIGSDQSLIIKKDTVNLTSPYYHSFKFRGYYNKLLMNSADLVFNFQGFIDLFESSATIEDFYRGLQYVTGTFGPTTVARFASHSSTETHQGCLTSAQVYNETGGYQISLLPRSVALQPEGGTFADLGLVPGNYDRIYLTFSGDCKPDLIPTGVAYRVKNNHGTWGTGNPVTFLFTGSFTIPGQRARGVVINPSRILDRFSDVKTLVEFEQLLPTVNDVVGTFAPGN